MARMRDRLDAPVLVGVGAAFDFHAGLVPQAPALDAAARPRVGVPAACRSRAACGGATCATTRASWSGFARQYVRHRLAARRASLAAMTATTSASSGCGRVGLPLALALRRRAACACSASTTTPSAWPRSRERPDAVRGAGRRRAARRASTLDLRPQRAADAAQADAIVLTLGTPSFSHIEIDMRDIRAVLDDLLPRAARGPPARAALDGRARHDRVRRRLPGEAPRLRGRRGHLRRPRARADRRRPLLRGDRHAAVHRRRRRRGARASAPRALFEPLGAPIVQTTPVQAELAKIWTNILRYATFALPEPADDGLRALRRERLRGHRPDQPRLPARRDARSRASPPARACARTSPSPRSARNAPGHAARRLARARVRAAVPRRGRQAPARRRCASARSPCSAWPSRRDTDDERDSLSHKLIRLLERELADVAVHDPARRDADAVLRRGHPRRRRGGHRDEPQRVPRPPGAGRDRRQRQGRRACSPTRGTASTPSRSSAGRPSWSPRRASARAGRPRGRVRRRCALARSMTTLSPSVVLFSRRPPRWRYRHAGPRRVRIPSFCRRPRRRPAWR